MDMATMISATFRAIVGRIDNTCFGEVVSVYFTFSFILYGVSLSAVLSSLRLVGWFLVWDGLGVD